VDEQETTAVAATVATVAAVGVRLRPRFRRGAAHGHACSYLRGLLSDAERKNGWQLAEQAGYGQPRAIQRVLDRSVWDADAVRDDLRAYVVDALGDPAGVLVVDETGFLKQGTKSVGVQRQYSGTAGRIENCQVGVFLSYASAKGRAGIDRALYLPQEWTADPARCAAAGVPADITFQTKPQLARAMVERALDAGVPTAWVTADEVYGNDYAFRHALEARAQAYVVAVKRTQTVSTWPPYGPIGQARGCDLVAALPDEAWQRLSCGVGAQGERVYDWAWVPLRPALQAGWIHALLVRRHPTKLEDLAYYLVHAPDGHPADGDGARGRYALDHRRDVQTRQGAGGAGPLRGAVVAGLAPAHDAFAVGTGDPGDGSCPGQGGEPPGDERLVPLSLPELRRLIVRLAAGHPLAAVLHWSRWRRHHQAVARACHIRRRRASLGEKRSL
jgi:FOG: Transposase